MRNTMKKKVKDLNSRNNRFEQAVAAKMHAVAPEVARLAKEFTDLRDKTAGRFGDLQLDVDKKFNEIGNDLKKVLESIQKEIDARKKLEDRLDTIELAKDKAS